MTLNLGWVDLLTMWWGIIICSTENLTRIKMKEGAFVTEPFVHTYQLHGYISSHRISIHWTEIDAISNAGA